jgi:hypothetical protein
MVQNQGDVAPVRKRTAASAGLLRHATITGASFFRDIKSVFARTRVATSLL